ncbi:nonsense-mediated mRNA decay factor SMG9 [Patella vulgata]|uniref:nonsense-mediated mRNA decay factor SMG9 n=1 Tax=Patella vulgata TaxID=6465 RepID=UPI00217F78CE|nr:nonsense-mediated mRNA decay factor SMG9 [Patella vulgata]
MSDPLDRDRSGRRRRRRDNKPIRKERDSREHDPSPTSSKPPIILGLAKPSQDPGASSNNSSPSAGSGIASKLPDKPIVVLRSRDDNRPVPSTNQSSNTLSTGEINTPPHITRQPSVGHLVFEASSQNRLVAPPEMKHSIKLVDETLRWCDNAMEMLLDQTDYLVIGAIGLQGSGKSTILSLLGGNSPQDTYRNYIFQPQTKETKEEGSHQTNGIDMFVSSERIILLDAQPVMSASLLDNLIRHDKKYPTEYSSAEYCIEMQSLQIATFLFTVCNVVLVVQDWFTDVNFLRFLQNAEMLKPPTPSSSHDGGSSQDDTPDYYPNVVFVQNKGSVEDFGLESYKAMQQTLLRVFENSRLKSQGCVSLATGGLLPGINNRTVETDFNLFILPTMEYYKNEQDSILSFLPEYRGYPSFNSLIKCLRNQLFSIPRTPLTHANLSEKNWFHYAARTWESVRKSQLLADYNRLLP